ncbi:D-aminoacid aminotransferase-like PLP-dependent enzyme [Penicillium cf. viridicatum]|uniref:D-aminoacid aminotransferase-like PLP-dependent enzyme n=1 Tax=Penicillium cf. viridicatum TaxID=2972119 RepID=A0A9W9JIC5_9EURO|nr:D-aminoacid aminotransferase-like PLP-dependent enzyme [Penicillium cf. viridicatum]
MRRMGVIYDSTFILVKDGVLYTPARDVLEGITRKSVTDAAKANDWKFVLSSSLAYNADEIFMSTTTGSIIPITSLDGRPVKDGKLGPITKKIWDTY